MFNFKENIVNFDLPWRPTDDHLQQFERKEPVLPVAIWKNRIFHSEATINYQIILLIVQVSDMPW